MYVKVRVKAGAKKEVVEEISPDTLHVQVKEPAKQNRANVRVGECVAAHFLVPIHQVKLISGHHQPSKIFSIPDEK